MKDALLSFETYTATLAGKGDAIDSIMRKADTAFASFDSMMTKIDNAVPDLTKGKDGELYKKIHSIHETGQQLQEALRRLPRRRPPHAARHQRIRDQGDAEVRSAGNACGGKSEPETTVTT